MSNPRLSFVTGINEIMQDWTTGTYRALLLDSGWVPDTSTDVFVSDIVADEFSAVGYARQTLGSKTRGVVLPAADGELGFVVFDCANPDFGVMSGGSVAQWIAVYKFVSTDANSPLVVAFQCFYEADGVASATFTVSVNGLYRDATSCPSDFS